MMDLAQIVECNNYPLELCPRSPYIRECIPAVWDVYRVVMLTCTKDNQRTKTDSGNGGQPAESGHRRE